MGTYTTNYNLFMPSIGEQGWGTLVNGNFTTIDTTMAGLNARLTAVENEVNGALSCTSVATSGTITSTGLITANGGIKGNLTGNVTGNITGLLFVKGIVGTSGDVNYATLAAQTLSVISISSSSPNTIQVNNYSISYGNPVKHGWGVYTRRSDLSGTTSPSVSTRTMTITVVSNITSGSVEQSNTYLYYKKSTESTYTRISISGYYGVDDVVISTLNVNVGSTYQFYLSKALNTNLSLQVSIPAGTTYKVKYTTP